MASPFPFTAGQVLTAAELNSIGEWTAFTPSWTNLTPGNATESWYYAQVQDVVFVEGQTVLGSTSSVTGLIQLAVPVGTAQTASDNTIGWVSYTGSGISLTQGFCDHTSQNLRCHIYNASTTYLSRTLTSSTVPWSGPTYTGGVLRLSARYRIS